MTTEKLEKQHRCSKCGVSLLRDEVWIPDDMKDKREFCGSHAPGDAIRLQDTIRPLNEFGDWLNQHRGLVA